MFHHHDDCIVIDGLCANGVSVTDRRTNQGGKGYYNVMIFDERFHGIGQADITTNYLKVFVRTNMIQTCLVVQKVIDNGNLMTLCQEIGYKY